MRDGDDRAVITVVIVDYNSADLLRRCLGSLAALGRADLDLIVVDNGGTLCADELQTAFPGLTVLRPSENLGFAGGCNLGIEQALDRAAEYCLLLNPDTKATKDFIAPLLAAMDSDHSIGMACPTIFDGDGEGRIGYGGAGVNWWTGRPYVIRERRADDNCPWVEVPFVSGAAMMLRTAAIRQVGRMEEEYFLYFEDADYSHAFRRAGWRVVYVPGAAVHHDPSKTVGYQSERYVFYFARNRIRFMRRCGRWHHRLVFTIFNSLVRLPGALLFFGLVRRRPGLAAAFVRGFVDGMRER